MNLNRVASQPNRQIVTGPRHFGSTCRYAFATGIETRWAEMIVKTDGMNRKRRPAVGVPLDVMAMEHDCWPDILVPETPLMMAFIDMTDALARDDHPAAATGSATGLSGFGQVLREGPGD